MSRQYDIVLLGANGYTGQYAAEHIVKHLPTDFKWAIAGRSQQKLSSLAEKLKEMNPDRTQPAVEIAQLSSADLNALAKKTKVLLNCVGPYHLYSTPVVEACATNGSHYIDVTGETPWVREIIAKYHDTAKANGSIMVPQNGLESAPADLITYTLATMLRKELSAATKEVVICIHEMSIQPSGGTLASLLGLFDHYSFLDIARSLLPNSLCPVQPPLVASPSLLTRLFGVRKVPDLGTLTTYLMGQADVALVYRSWGLMSPSYNANSQGSYGPNFQFTTYMRSRNAFTGALAHFGQFIAALMIAMPPVRWLARRFAFQPGQGVSPEDAAREVIEYRAVALPDSASPKRAFARVRWEGGIYHLTGIFLVEAAMTIIKHEESLRAKLTGGILTPATLGPPYIERLADVGFRIDAKMLDY